MSYPQRCETAGCHEPAHWFVDTFCGTGFYACEEHTMVALRETSYEVSGAIDEDPVCLQDGEIARAS